MPAPQKKKIEFNRVYRRLESADRHKEDHSNLSPSIEIIGDTPVEVYGSNLPRQDGCDIYKSPIDNGDIVSKMRFTDILAGPGMFDACLCTVWIAFISSDVNNPPCMYDCGIIDWEFSYRQDNPC